MDLYQSIENAALKRSEKAKPLPSPNFPKLPQKRIKHKSGGNSTLVGLPFVNQGENWENQGYLNFLNLVTDPIILLIRKVTTLHCTVENPLKQKVYFTLNMEFCFRTCQCARSH